MSKFKEGQGRIEALVEKGWDAAAGIRLREAADRMGYKQTTLAKEAGVARGTLHNIFTGITTPRETTLQALCKVIGVEMLDILDPEQIIRVPPGGGPEKDIAASASMVREAHIPFDAEQHDGQEMVLVNRYRAVASAGTGLIPIRESAEDAMAFHPAWLSSLGVPKGRAAIITVKGDSMDPVIRDGAMVLIQRTDEFVGDGVYVFSRDDEVMIKRLSRVETDNSAILMITSENRHYPPEHLSGDAMNAIRLIGRVRYVMSPI